MEDFTIITEKDNYRVIAEHDMYAFRPEWQGYPSVLLSHDWRESSIDESWEGAVDTDAIQRALNELDDDVFDRWVRVFGADLVNRKAAGLSEDDPAAKVYVQAVTGYYQGNEWTLLTWVPETLEEEPNVDENDLVNWARGDVYILHLQKVVTWTTDDDDFDDREEWETVESVGGYYVQWPDNSEWVKEAAEGMIPDSK